MLKVAKYNVLSLHAKCQVYRLAFPIIFFLFHMYKAPQTKFRYFYTMLKLAKYRDSDHVLRFSEALIFSIYS